MKGDGIAIHFTDLSDHFQHQDRSIISINFLRYSEAEWNRIAENQFAYCNRLRASDYLALFKKAGLDICRLEIQEDYDALEIMKNGFVVDEKFRDYSVDDLCGQLLKTALKAEGKDI